MVCPMRFVLVGVSVCLAWIAAWRCMASEDHKQEQESSMQAGQQRQAACSSKRAAAALQGLLSWSTLLDMFTGKYIYNYCTGKGAHVVKAS